MWLRVAAMAPRVVVTDVEVQEHGDGFARVEATVANVGYLPTYVLPSAQKLPWNEPLWAEVATEGCELTDPADALSEIGHLDGWGRGLHGGAAAIYFSRSRGSTGTRKLRWTLKGSGKLSLRVGSCRVGWIDRTVHV